MRGPAGTAAAAVTLGGNTTITTGTGPIAFNGTIDGAQSLTLNSTGTTTLAGAVGGSTPLSSLTTNAGGTTAVNGGSVTTTGNQVYGDAVTLTQATTFTTTGGGSAVSFGNNVTNTLAGASITVTTPALSLANGSTVATTGNGNISFIVDGLTPGTASINAGTGTFQISPSTPTKTIEYGDVDTARVTDVYYGSTFTNITAGQLHDRRGDPDGRHLCDRGGGGSGPHDPADHRPGRRHLRDRPLCGPQSRSGRRQRHGGITLGQNVTLGTGTLRLTTTGGITQSGGSLTANLLGASAGTGISLSQAGNDVNVVAAQSAAGGLTLRDSDDLVIGAAPAVPGLHPAITGDQCPRPKRDADHRRRPEPDPAHRRR